MGVLAQMPIRWKTGKMRNTRFRIVFAWDFSKFSNLKFYNTLSTREFSHFPPRHNEENANIKQTDDPD